MPILASPRTDLPASWLLDQLTLPSCPNSEDTLTNLPLRWYERQAAETDPSLKQWIPYILLLKDDHYAAYPRPAKMHQKPMHSLGLGGHVEKEDQQDNLPTTLRAGAVRELQEETGLPSELGDFRFLGLINEERSHLGQTHLGAVFLFTLSSSMKITPTEEIPRIHWVPRHQHLDPSFELWSHLAYALGKNSQ